MKKEATCFTVIKFDWSLFLMGEFSGVDMKEGNMLLSVMLCIYFL